MATSATLGLYLPDGSDYVSVDRDLNDNYTKIDNAFGGLFLVKNYASVISSLTSGNKSYKGSAFGIVDITGYTPLALMQFSSDNANILLRGWNLNELLSEDNNSIFVRQNNSSSQSNVTISLTVIWVKTAYLDDQRTS